MVEFKHVPVLFDECMEGLNIKPNGIYFDGTLGGAGALLLGINPAFGGAIGIAALFSGVTNCPFATVVLACEMFGIEGVGYYLVASAISFALSGKTSLYNGRKLPFVQDK